MKRFFVVMLSLGLLVAGIALERWAQSERKPLPAARDPRLIAEPNTNARTSNSINKKFVIDVSQMLIKLNELRFDERPDQIADWAVYGTLLRSGLSSDEIRQATLGTLPFRFPNLEEVLNFDYGRGRRALRADGSVWLFYSDKDEQASATLARLADKVRMERGDVPKTFSIFRYHSELSEGIISVEQEPDIPASRFFSQKYGYIEQKVSTTKDFITWLNNIDDVVHIKKLDNGRLELGGRRIVGVRTQGADVEDVAALYQAHQHIAKESQNVNRQLQELRKPLVDAFDAARRDYQQKMLLAGKRPLHAPGFSLDPQWDTQGLVRDLTQLLTNPEVVIRAALKLAGETNRQNTDESAQPRIVSTALDVASVFPESTLGVYRTPDEWRQTIQKIIDVIHNKSGREGGKAVSSHIYKLREDLKGEGKRRDSKGKAANQLLATLDYIESLHRMQCARYDGPLQGTRVGMTLFYTDLLAKLWAGLDYYREAPIHEIYGFRSGPIEAPYLEPLYWAEAWALRDTRLWFGLKGDAYKWLGPKEAVEQGGSRKVSEINFAHISTRVYAAGTNPLKPDEETTPAEANRRTLSWWDRHFAKVADYEQAYHVQNQIMKWSVITGWMVENNYLRNLENIAVNSSHRFDHWYQNTHDLRFRRDVAFLPEQQWLGGTECIAILRSYSFPFAGRNPSFIEGGVSLESAKALKFSARIQEEIPLQSRYYWRDSSKSREVENFGGTTFRPRPVKEGHAATEATVSQSARSRSGPAEIPLTTLTTEVVTQRNQGRIIVATDRGTLGEMHFELDRGGVRMIWHNGITEADRKLLEKAAPLFRGKDAAPKLASHEAFLPSHEAYVIERKDLDVGVVLLPTAEMGGGSGGRLPPKNRGSSFSGGDGDMGGGGEPPPPRFFTASSKNTGKNIYLRIATGSLLGMLLGLPGDDRPQETVEATILTQSQAREHINRARWQRLRPLPDKAGDIPGRVERVFTDQGPTDQARHILVQTRDSELGTLNGFVEGDALFLERPQHEARSRRFNDLVVTEGINSHYLRKVISESLQTTGEYTAPPALSVSVARGTRVALHTVQGNYKETIAEFRAAAQEGKLREVVESYKHQLPTELLSQSSKRVILPAIAHFTPGDFPSSKRGEVELAYALDALHRRELQKVAETLRATIDRTQLSSSAIRTAVSAFDHAGSPAASDYLLMRLGQVPRLSAEVADRIELQPLDFVLQTTLKKDVLKERKVLSMAEQANLATLFRDQPPSIVYIEDSKLLNKLDWDGLPRPSLMATVKDQHVLWEQFSPEGLGFIRPSHLVDGTKRFVRRDIPRYAMRRTSEARADSRDLRLSRRPLIYVIRSCDENNDGKVDSQEQQRCVHE